LKNKKIKRTLFDILGSKGKIPKVAVYDYGKKDIQTSANGPKN